MNPYARAMYVIEFYRGVLIYRTLYATLQLISKPSRTATLIVPRTKPANL